jgi:Ca-activated chloride channel family protein
MDPALLEYLGNNLFKLSIVPVNALSEVRASITYVEMLNYDFGKVNYKFLLNTTQLSSKPIETVHLIVDAKSQNIFKYFKSPSHGNMIDTKINMLSNKHYTLEFGDENFTPDKDLEIQFETVRNEIQFTLLTYAPTVQDSMGTSLFYTLWATPPDSIANDKIIPKDIVFTADVSSSMEGERLQQVKSALNNFLALLNPNDRFNILTFGTFINKFKPDLVPATLNNINDAKNYVYQLYALGLTNIDQALVETLKLSYNTASSCNVVFLTDGQPTWGETRSDSIISHVSLLNKNSIRIFSFGVGEDVSKSLLTNLSAQNHGYAQFIKSDDSISTIVNNQFTRISKPVMKDIAISINGLRTWDQYPKTLSDLFWGSQIVQYGLYDNKGTFDVKLAGTILNQAVEYHQNIAFTDTSRQYRFVPRLWAKSKIDYLLDLIQVYGELPELVKQVTDLSLQFQILTPYSAFYVDPTKPTGVEKLGNSIPKNFSLMQNYPNPFNPETTIEYNLPAQARAYNVVIRIYNFLGQLVRELVNQEQSAGRYSIVWNGKDNSGHGLASGVYIYTIQAGEFRQAKKMVLMK